MDTSGKQLLIVGAGQAGAELAICARQYGWTGAITLLGEEPTLPYQRPPLSKAWLAGKVDADNLLLRPRSAYEAAGIQLRTGVRVQAIGRQEQSLRLESGELLSYDFLALCMGGRPRLLTCSGIDPQRPPRNLHYLRSMADAEGIRAQLHPGVRLVVVGGGYVGLEVAATARGLGAEVIVLEAQPRVLSRVAGAELSDFYQQVHRSAGVDLRTGAQLEAIEVDAGTIRAVYCKDGARIPADLVVAGLGMLPNVELARAAGLADEGGIPIDDFSVSSDPHVLAAGDCTLQHSAWYDRQVRVESVPNALEQARAAASWIAGKPKAHRSVPWFWSDQYDLKLQMAGLSQGHERCILRGEPRGRSFSAFYVKGSRLLAVDAVNRPADFMLAKRALAHPCHVDADVLGDESVALKDLLAQQPKDQGNPPRLVTPAAP